MSTKLIDLITTDGSKMYIQCDEVESENLRAVGFFDDAQDRTEKFKETMISTVRGYSETILNSLQSGLEGLQKPDKVTLEYGLQIGGETGIPFVTKGNANANLKVTIEWSLNKEFQR